MAVGKPTDAGELVPNAALASGANEAKDVGFCWVGATLEDGKKPGALPPRSWDGGRGEVLDGICADGWLPPTSPGELVAGELMGTITVGLWLSSLCSIQVGLSV